MKIILANPHGFCAGVNRAVDIVNLALKKYGPPIYIKHHIVHNEIVVQKFEEKGIIFVEELSEIPKGSKVIFSAHGSSKNDLKKAKEEHEIVIDAICPLVKNIHNLTIKYDDLDYHIIVIGQPSHIEVKGTIGQISNQSNITIVSKLEEVEKLQIPNEDKVCYVTQTTLSIDDTKDIVSALKIRFPNIISQKDNNICYATQNRQNAVKKIISQGVDCLLVIGSKASSNATKLYELGIKNNINSYLIKTVKDIQIDWFRDIKYIGITAAASAPEFLVNEIVDFLKKEYNTEVEYLNNEEEDTKFFLPKELRR